MARAYVAVGSNIRPAENVREAVRLLAQRAKVVATSTVYETEPEGGRKQPSYYNCVIAIETDVPPLELKRSLLLPIEDELGRRRSGDRYASRTIDLDLIVYDGVALEGEGLVLPDPDIRERAYLAAPLLELDPGLELPDTGERIAEIAARLGSAGMRPLTDYTEELRRDIADGHR